MTILDDDDDGDATGAYASHTAQLTLNADNEYEGGRLCFFTGEPGVLSIPERPAGTLTKHDRDILHGVTRLHRGVRYSLFVVDQANGLGERDVFHLDKKAVCAILKEICFESITELKPVGCNERLDVPVSFRLLFNSSHIDLSRVGKSVTLHTALPRPESSRTRRLGAADFFDGSPAMRRVIVEGEATYNAEEQRVTFMPSTLLSFGARCTLQLNLSGIIS